MCVVLFLYLFHALYSRHERSSLIQDRSTSLFLPFVTGKLYPRKCKHCSYRSPYEADMLMHEKCHGEEAVYICEFDSDVLGSGLLKEMLEPLYQCSLCLRKFQQKMSLVRHLKSHTGERPFQCPLCPKSFNQKCNMERHIRSHTGERPYKCEVCAKRFNCKSNLSRHMLCHAVKVHWGSTCCGHMVL